MIDPNISRPVLVDVISVSKNHQIPSAVLAPLGKFVELPFTTRKISPFELAMFLTRRKDIFRVVQFFLFWVVWFMVWVLSQIIISKVSGSSQPILQGVFSVISAFSAVVNSDKIKKFMNAINPEDNDLILKDKKLQTSSKN